MSEYARGKARLATVALASDSTHEAQYPVRAADRLVAIAGELRDAAMPLTRRVSITLQKVAAAGLRNTDAYGNDWPSNIAAIYRINCGADMAAQLWEMASAEQARRVADSVSHRQANPGTKLKHAYDMARLIGWESGKTCLYVGRSDKLSSRLRQHLGPLSKNTFAMHLSMWVPQALWVETVEIEY
ncbi:hypothetical protein [Noviherbaspirillum malthae]|uniref:hypothetical protein n=1 Tax=Noviherbaspirillum malthae TaxID=1260987 RepID=UPI00188FC55D|nr:hypothetical protein [Noviherbaspirillum malthae]